MISFYDSRRSNTKHSGTRLLQEGCGWEGREGIKERGKGIKQLKQTRLGTGVAVSTDQGDWKGRERGGDGVERGGMRNGEAGVRGKKGTVVEQDTTVNMDDVGMRRKAQCDKRPRSSMPFCPCLPRSASHPRLPPLHPRSYEQSFDSFRL